MKKNSFTIILLIVFLIGLSLLLYPSISNYWNSFTQSKTIKSYNEKLSEIDDEEYEQIRQSAINYNTMFKGNKDLWVLSDEQRENYNSQLNILGNGIMGYISIPAINCELPIYHGTSDSVLQVAVGHLEGSSLPIGGIGTHCVLSGHRGLPSAKLFTNLDELMEGDTFILCVLDEVLTYEVDQIRIIEPDDLSELYVDPQKDLCTLITCTPYGVNSHRLLVRGHRVETVLSSNARVTADALQIEPTVVAPIVAIPLLLILLVYIILKDSGIKRSKRRFEQLKKHDTEE